MKVGVTATRSNLTEAQILSLEKLLLSIDFEEAHHGDCVGGDSMFHQVVREVNPDVKIVIHPPVENGLRAFCMGDESREQKTYFARNRAIIDEVDLLIGIPFGFVELPKGGTWYTIKKAQGVKDVKVIFPDGRIKSFDSGSEKVFIKSDE